MSAVSNICIFCFWMKIFFHWINGFSTPRHIHYLCLNGQWRKGKRMESFIEYNTLVLALICNQEAPPPGGRNLSCPTFAQCTLSGRTDHEVPVLYSVDVEGYNLFIYPSVPTHSLSDPESAPLHPRRAVGPRSWSRTTSSRKCSFGCVNSHSSKSCKSRILSLHRLRDRDSATYALKGVNRPLGDEPMSTMQYYRLNPGTMIGDSIWRCCLEIDIRFPFNNARPGHWCSPEERLVPAHRAP